MEVSGKPHTWAAIFPGESGPGTHRIGDLVGSGADLEALEKRTIYFPCRESNHNSSGVQPFELYVLLMVRLATIACMTELARIIRGLSRK